jgi:hypothetical protein
MGKTGITIYSDRKDYIIDVYRQGIQGTDVDKHTLIHNHKLFKNNRLK